jgi:hypothetical protein
MMAGFVQNIAKIAWASPCSLLGIVLAAPLGLAGARARLSSGTIEVFLRINVASCGRLERALPYRAITFGHVIIAVTGEEIEQLRSHERAHVKQYERWGIAFFIAYAVSGAWQVLKGRSPYWDNHFEVEARACSPCFEEIRCESKRS